MTNNKAIKIIIALALVTLISPALGGCVSEGINRLSYNDYCGAKELMDEYSSMYYDESSVLLASDKYINSLRKPFDEYGEAELKLMYSNEKAVFDEAVKCGFTAKDFSHVMSETYLPNIENYAKHGLPIEEPDKSFMSHVIEKAKTEGKTYREYFETILDSCAQAQFAREYLMGYYYENIYEGSFKAIDYSGMSDEEMMLAYNDIVCSDEYQAKYIEFLKGFDEYCENLE